MKAGARKKIVILGMVTKMPVAGVVWQTAHYLVGFQRMGYDVYYVESHARTPTPFMKNPGDDASVLAANFIAAMMRRFDLGADRWCFNALHEESPRCLGMSDSQLKQLYRDAALIINLHGGTQPLPEHYATNRLVYLETDPVELQVELYNKQQSTIEFLKPHCAFFTFGENYGQADCKLPVTDLFPFHMTRQPVVMDFWKDCGDGPGSAFTTIGNWEQRWRTIRFNGEEYAWSKHFEFMKFIDLPQKSSQVFELALSSYTDDVKAMLEGKGWHVRHAMDFSMDTDRYRSYITGSRGEFTVAKDQNVRLRSGWFSDRAVTYLAAGRPVITQDTGFGNILPTGKGLFAFSTFDDILAAVDAVNADYAAHRRAALEVAQEHFSHEGVLGRLLAEVDV